MRDKVFAAKLHICNRWRSLTGCTCVLIRCRFYPFVMSARTIARCTLTLSGWLCPWCHFCPHSAKGERVGVRKNDCPRPPPPLAPLLFPLLLPLPPVDTRLQANWSQCCPIGDWSRLLRPLICLVWWALVEVIQPLNLPAYLSNSWANTHSPSALGLIFKHLEKTGPSVYASIFPHICT